MTRIQYQAIRKTTLAAVLFSAILITSGCGGSEFTEASGRVTIDGAPVTAGSVYFVSATDPNQSGGGPLSSDGTFKAFVPVGKTKVAIQTRAFKPKDKNEQNPGAVKSGPGVKGPPAWAKKGPKAPEATAPSSEVLAKTSAGAPDGTAAGGTYVAIPDRYEDPTTSGLEFEIKRGSNALGEIKLSSK